MSFHADIRTCPKRIQNTHFFKEQINCLWQGLVMPWQRPILTLLTFTIITVLLIAALTLWMLEKNISSIKQPWEVNEKITLFLKPNISYTQVLPWIKRLQQHHSIEKIRYISPEQGLAQLARYHSNEILNKLNHNPLPWVIQLLPSLFSSSITELSQVIKEINTSSLIDYMQFSSEKIEQHYKKAHLLQIHLHEALIALLVLIIFLLFQHLLLSHYEKLSSRLYSGIFYAPLLTILAFFAINEVLIQATEAINFILEGKLLFIYQIRFLELLIIGASLGGMSGLLAVLFKKFSAL